MLSTLSLGMKATVRRHPLFGRDGLLILVSEFDENCIRFSYRCGFRRWRGVVLPRTASVLAEESEFRAAFFFFQALSCVPHASSLLSDCWGVGSIHVNVVSFFPNLLKTFFKSEMGLSCFHFRTRVKSRRSWITRLGGPFKVANFSCRSPVAISCCMSSLRRSMIRTDLNNNFTSTVTQVTSHSLTLAYISPCLFFFFITAIPSLHLPPRSLTHPFPFHSPFHSSTHFTFPYILL